MLKKLSKLVLAFVIIAVLFFAFIKGFDYYKKVCYPTKYSEFVVKYSELNNMDPHFIYAVIKTESKFNPEAVSDVGARGLMQLMPDAYDWIKYRMKDERIVSYDDMFNPEYNIEYGTYMLKLLTDEYGDTPTAVAAYHAGRGTVNKWLKDSQYSKDGKKLDSIPSETTSHYVKKVMNAYNSYKNLYK